MDWDTDVDKCLRPFSEPGGLTFNGQVVLAKKTVRDGQVTGDADRHGTGRILSVQVRTTSVPGITIDSPVIFQGSNWRVDDFESSGDGRILTLLLVAAS